jgi:hypothetical protein
MTAVSEPPSSSPHAAVPFRLEHALDRRRDP